MPYQELRRRADSVSKRSKVGIPIIVPLDAEFGDGDLEGLPTVVRLLETNASERILYRLMWPLTEKASSYLLEAGTVRREDLPPEELEQLLFLDSWYAYVNHGSPADLEEALNRWGNLYSNDDFDKRLAEILAAEDELELSKGYDLLYAAQGKLQRQLLTHAISDAARRWELNEPEEAITITKTVLDSPLDDEDEELSLEPMLAIGRRLEYRVKEITEEVGTEIIDSPTEVLQLDQLAKLLSDRHPSARGWASTLSDWYAVRANVIRRLAVQKFEQEDYPGALRLLEQALTLATEPQLKARLRGDINAVISHQPPAAGRGGGLLSVEEPEIHPIDATFNLPWLGTLNGCGCKIYCTGIVEPWKVGRGDLSYAIPYVTVAFVPVVPLGRYVVLPEGGGWRFFGWTRWTAWMKAHTAIVLLIGLLISMTSSGSGSGSAGPFSSYETQPFTTSSTPDIPADPPMQQPLSMGC